MPTTGASSVLQVQFLHLAIPNSLPSLRILSPNQRKLFPTHVTLVGVAAGSYVHAGSFHPVTRADHAVPFR